MRRALLAVTTGLALSGCAGAPVIPSNDISGLITQIKRDVGHYNSLSYPQLKAACAPNGESIRFKVTRVDLSLNAKVEATGNVGGSASAPTPVPGGTVGPSVAASRASSGSEVIDLALIPEASAAAYKETTAPADTPISDALEQITQGIADAANTQPCFRIGGPMVNLDGSPLPPLEGENDIKNTITFGLSKIKTREGAVTFTLGLVGINAGRKVTSTNGNTVAVTIQPVGKIAAE